MVAAEESWWRLGRQVSRRLSRGGAGWGRETGASVMSAGGEGAAGGAGEFEIVVFEGGGHAIAVR